VLERGGRYREGVGEVGGGIAKVVRGGRVEEAAEGVLIGREGQLEKGAAAEDDEPDPILGCGREHLRLRALGGVQPGQALWFAPGEALIRGVHGTGEVEQDQHVASSMGQQSGPHSQLRSGQRDQAKHHGCDSKADARPLGWGVGQGRRVGQQRLVSEERQRVAAAALSPHRPPGERE